jgi:hypothetical protein
VTRVAAGSPSWSPTRLNPASAAQVSPSKPWILLLGFAIEDFLSFLFDSVLILSNPNHFLLVPVVETLDLNQIESA